MRAIVPACCAILAIATGVWVNAADKPVTASAAPAFSAVFVEADAPDVAEIRSLGEQAINRVSAALVAELSAALAQAGPEHAVAVRHLKALPLTGESMGAVPRVTSVKRTSLRLRNPANAPDEAEQLALARVQQVAAAGNPPPTILVQRIDRPAGEREWRVYRPISVLPQCITCHGPVATQPPALRETLQKLYPADQATGYAAGDWRGLIGVTIADRPAARPMPAMPTKKLPARKT